MVCDCSVGGWWLGDCVCDEFTRSQKNKTTTPITKPIIIIIIACRVRRMRACDRSITAQRRELKNHAKKNRQTHKKHKGSIDFNSCMKNRVMTGKNYSNIAGIFQDRSRLQVKSIIRPLIICRHNFSWHWTKCALVRRRRW